MQYQQLHAYAPLMAARRAFRYNFHGYCTTDETANKQRVAVANHAHDKVPQRWWPGLRDMRSMHHCNFEILSLRAAQH
jgi:hypothetical protein